jgi:hypothetical protein
MRSPKHKVGPVAKVFLVGKGNTAVPQQGVQRDLPRPANMQQLEQVR